MTSALGRMPDYDEAVAAGILEPDDVPLSRRGTVASDAEPWPTEPPPEDDWEPRRPSAATRALSAESAVSPDPTPLSAHSALSAQSLGPPELPDAALHGLVGDLVHRIDPHTEADPAAVLITLLTVLGNLIGPGPSVSVGATRHRANLFALVVGATAKARKGTSLAEGTRVGRLLDETWAAECMTSGIASGEGVIALVADTVEDDEEPRDRRALIVEEEFARLLNTGRREGSTVSPIIRAAWDGRPLRITTKANSVAASGHLISVVGHITRDELHQRLTDVDVANGLANRFLLVFATRSKLLPSGGNLYDEDLADLIDRADTIVRTARQRGDMRRTPAAAQRWAELYEQMADDDPGGLLGAITARAEPQVLRLSLVYALLDGADAIDVAHLDAASALWSYCRASAAYLFGAALGDPVADRIDAALGDNPGGLDRTALRGLFAGHVRSGQIDAALELLDKHGRITQHTEDTAGRPRTIYRRKGNR